MMKNNSVAGFIYMVLHDMTEIVVLQTFLDVAGSSDNRNGEHLELEAMQVCRNHCIPHLKM